MKRYSSVIGVKQEKIKEYTELHANAWPEVLEMIKKANIRNYSIYLRELEKGKFYLFSYFEYVGDDFQADQAMMAANPMTQKWRSLCCPCHTPIELRGKDEWWATMEEVFHSD